MENKRKYVCVWGSMEKNNSWLVKHTIFYVYAFTFQFNNVECVDVHKYLITPKKHPSLYVAQHKFLIRKANLREIQQEESIRRSLFYSRVELRLWLNIKIYDFYAWYVFFLCCLKEDERQSLLLHTPSSVLFLSPLNSISLVFLFRFQTYIYALSIGEHQEHFYYCKC